MAEVGYDAENRRITGIARPENELDAIRWDEFLKHIGNYNNPHHVSTGQVSEASGAIPIVLNRPDLVSLVVSEATDEAFSDPVGNESTTLNFSIDNLDFVSGEVSEVLIYGQDVSDESNTKDFQFINTIKIPKGGLDWRYNGLNGFGYYNKVYIKTPNTENYPNFDADAVNNQILTIGDNSYKITDTLETMESGVGFYDQSYNIDSTLVWSGDVNGSNHNIDLASFRIITSEGDVIISSAAGVLTGPNVDTATITMAGAFDFLWVSEPTAGLNLYISYNENRISDTDSTGWDGIDSTYRYTLGSYVNPGTLEIEFYDELFYLKDDGEGNITKKGNYEVPFFKNGSVNYTTGEVVLHLARERITYSTIIFSYEYQPEYKWTELTVTNLNGTVVDMSIYPDSTNFSIKKADTTINFNSLITRNTNLLNFYCVLVNSANEPALDISSNIVIPYDLAVELTGVIYLSKLASAEGAQLLVNDAWVDIFSGYLAHNELFIRFRNMYNHAPLNGIINFYDGTNTTIDLDSKVLKRIDRYLVLVQVTEFEDADESLPTSDWYIWKEIKDIKSTKEYYETYLTNLPIHKKLNIWIGFITDGYDESGLIYKSGDNGFFFDQENLVTTTIYGKPKDET